MALNGRQNTNRSSFLSVIHLSQVKCCSLFQLQNIRHLADSFSKMHFWWADYPIFIILFDVEMFLHLPNGRKMFLAVDCFFVFKQIYMRNIWSGLYIDLQHDLAVAIGTKTFLLYFGIELIFLLWVISGIFDAQRRKLELIPVRTENAQISLRGCAGWSGHSLFSSRFYKQQWACEMAKTVCVNACCSGPSLPVNCIRVFFVWCAF